MRTKKIYLGLAILSTLFLLAFYFPQSKQTKTIQKKDTTTLVKKEPVKTDSVALKSQKDMKTIMMQQKIMDSVLMQKKAKK